MKKRNFKCRDNETEEIHYGHFYGADDPDIAQEELTYRCQEEDKTLICLFTEHE